MARQLKRWESPREEGRNDKGKGGSARQRQRRKQMQMMRNRLKQQGNNPEKRGESDSPLFLCELEIGVNADGRGWTQMEDGLG